MRYWLILPNENCHGTVDHIRNICQDMFVSYVVSRGNAQLVRTVRKNTTYWIIYLCCTLLHSHCTPFWDKGWWHLISQSIIKNHFLSYAKFHLINSILKVQSNKYKSFLWLCLDNLENSAMELVLYSSEE